MTPTELYKPNIRIIAFVMFWWTNQEHAKRLENGWSSLANWHRRIIELLSPFHCFIASGTWSEPSYSPINIPVVNSGVTNSGVYDGRRRHYGKCAFSAALAYALNRNDWDLLVTLDNDGLVGDVDMDNLLRSFMVRPEMLLAPGWHSHPGGPFLALKRDGASRLAHKRTSQNIRDDSDEVPESGLWEMEVGHIFRDGRWWNPWPNILEMTACGQPKPTLEQNWPFVTQPGNDISGRFIAEKCPLAKPLKKV